MSSRWSCPVKLVLFISGISEGIVTVSVEFDDGVAVKLQVALKDTADVVQNMSHVRSDAMESSLRDFAGGYARAFIMVCQSEADDRRRLVGVLTDVHQTIERLRWAARQAVGVVEQQAQQAAAAAALVPNLKLFSPVEVPAAPLTFPATYTPGPRARTV